MHINYCEIASNSFGKRTIDDICRIAAELGYDGIQFRGSAPKEMPELSFRGFAEIVATAKKKYGLSDILFGIGVANCTSEDKEVREKGIATAIENAKIANDLCGTTVSNCFGPRLLSTIPNAPRSGEFNGSAVATERDWNLTADAYSRVGRELEKTGVKFAFETHAIYINDTPQATKKLVDLIDSPAVGVNMDYGNTVYFPEHPSLEECIDLYGDKLFYIHFKNSSAVPGTKARIPTGLGDGEINHRAYLEKLRDVGFDGPICIEAPRNGDRIWFAKQDLEYYKDVVSSI